VSLPRKACSDGAGNVISIGTKGKDFLVGDKVCTLFNQGHQAGPLTPEIAGNGLGGAIDGALRQCGVFPETGLVAAPSILTPIEAGTLTCAPLTAWNPQYGLESKALKVGDTVVTQGTGGVALSAIQFARAAGAVVIATTSTNEKAEFLEKLGVNHVVRYEQDQSWGEIAKRFSQEKLALIMWLRWTAETQWSNI
jgi:NADPH:quinone reductase-like Zn-dependent oxidoreductase